MTQQNDDQLIKKAILEITQLRGELAAARRQQAAPIAIIGLDCRLPQADGEQAYWRLLEEGIDAIGPVPPERWDAAQYYDADPEAPGKMYVNEGGFVDDLAGFDAAFFGIAGREALYLDPQQRMLLETAWHALENAGYGAHKLADTRTGIFVGISNSDYAQRILANGAAAISAYLGTGNANSTASGRLAYVLGLKGPTLSIDTACSSSLAAVHQAVQSLRQGECRVALAGGVNALSAPESSINCCKGRMLSPEARCKTFDTEANGYVRGEGCGVVVLKRLADALADGDHIRAVIRGSALNHDGHTSGLTVPNGPAQQAVISAALENAGLTPADIDYIEAHGTGTALGDPIEIGALAQVFGAARDKADPLRVGTVKTQIGHLESAAGIAGLIKVVLALEHASLPANLHFKAPSPHMAWDEIPLEVCATQTAWARRGERRRAGVSSFGFSGTNAHLVLEEAPPLEAHHGSARDAGGAALLPLAARDATALRALAARYAEALAAQPARWRDLLKAAQEEGMPADERAVFAGASATDLCAALQAFARGAAHAGILAHGRLRPALPKLALLFTGSLGHLARDGLQLFAHPGAETLRATIMQCDTLLRALVPEAPALSDICFGERALELQRDGYGAAAHFALGIGLYRQWCDWGLLPAALYGEGAGELCAAVAAGAIALDDGLHLAAALGGLLPADTAGVKATIAFRPPSIALVAHPGGILGDELDADYWCDDLDEPLPGMAGICRLADIGCRAYLEIGAPHAGIEAGQRMLAEMHGQAPLFHCGGAPGSDALTAALAVLAQWQCFGERLQWQRIDSHRVQQRMALPTYPFQHERFWIEAPAAAPLRSNAAAHPLLGTRVPLLGSEEIRYQALLHAKAPAYLGDHYVYEQLVVPGAALFSMAWQAALQLPLSRERLALQEATLLRPVVLPEHGARLVQLTLTADGEDAWRFKILSQDPAVLEQGGEEEPLVHAFGRIALAAAPARPASVDLAAYRAAAIQPASKEECYAEIRRLGVGIHPGTAFEVVQELWTDTRSSSLGRLALAAGTRGEEAHYLIHPTLLDGAFQSIGGLALAQPGARTDDLRLPTGFRQFRIFAPIGAETFALARVTSSSTTEIIADITFVNPDGRVAGEIEAFRMHLVSPATLLGQTQHKVQDWLYDLEWVGATDTPAKEQADEQAYWLLFADHTGMADRLARSQRCIRVSASVDEALAAQLDAASANPLEADYRIALDGDLLAQMHTVLDGAASAGRCRGIVHLWSLDLPASCADGAAMQAAQQRSCASALALVQALAQRGQLADAPLLLVTEGTAQAGRTLQTLAPTLSVAQSPLWGLGSVIAAEYPELRCQLVDLEPGRGHSTLLDALNHAGSSESRIRYLDGQRQAARLARAAARQGLARPAGEFRLGLASFGVLDELKLEHSAARAPAADEVQIEVRAAGLNFRDVMTALGMFSEVLAGLGIHDASQLTLGGECTGVVVACGSQVTRFAIGDEVIAVPVAGAFASRVNAPQACVVKKPAALDFNAAATVGATFLTAHYALRELTTLKRGERVLIHAAAGGLGLAAVQIAQAAGAQIFATASRGKWDFLRSLGVTHIMDSRSLGFADEIMAATGGRGVDVVLNSLNGAFIDKSLAVLAPGGRFLEAGKIGVRSVDEMRAQRPDVDYRLFDLYELSRRAPQQVTAMLEALAQELAAGALRPLEHRVFSVEDSAAAFRHMAQARHVGKVVLDFAARTAAPAVRAQRSYLVTGGLGALGLQVTRWLASQGAQDIVLTGRRRPDAEQQAALNALQRDCAGLRLHVMPADLAARAEVDALMQAIATQLPPLAGLVHAAGVLDDGMLAEQDWARFDKVMAPKVAGAWNLHLATQKLELDFFVLFSSLAATIGAPGQGNYVAANAFLDGLGQLRRQLGLPALVLNWGPWAEAGMAARLDPAAQARMQAQGIRVLRPEEGLAALAALLGLRNAQRSVAAIDWNALRATLAQDEVAPLLLPLWQAAQAPAAANDAPVLLARLAAAAPAERQALLLEHLRETMAQVLGLALNAVDPARNLFDMGMDSLMAVEFRNRIRRSTNVTLPGTAMADHPSLAGLAGWLAAHVKLDAPAAPADQAPTQKAAVRTRSETAPVLLTLQAGRAARQPIFCVPGAGANVAGLHHFAAALGSEQPFFGFQARGLDGETPPLDSIEAMAHLYIRAMREVQAEGPWQIVGHSFGGWIAFEMARQLQAAGETIGPLVLLDAIVPCAVARPLNRARDSLDKMLQFIEILEMGIPHKLGLDAEGLRLLEEDERIALLFQRMQRARLLSGLAGIKAVRGMLNVFSSNLNTSYTPATPYEGEVLLLQPQDSLLDRDEVIRGGPPQLEAWLAHAPAMQRLPVTGNHMSMLNPPHAQALAGLVRTHARLAGGDLVEKIA